MTYTGVALDGAKKFRKELKQADVNLKDLRKPFAATAKTVAAAARPRTPRKTGALSKTIRAGASRTSARVTAGNNAAVLYANPIHWGWPARGITGRPWLSWAAQSTEPQWIREFEHLMEQVVTDLGQDYRSLR